MSDVRAGTEDLTIVMSHGLAISGRIVGPDGGPPPAGGRLYVAPTGAKITGSTNPWRPVRPAADGSFVTLPLDPAVTWDLHVTHFPAMDEGYVRKLSAGATDVIVRLSAGLVIPGRVVTEDGRPAVGARVGATGVEPVARQLYRIRGRIQTADGEPVRGFIGYRQDYPGGGMLSSGARIRDDGTFEILGLRAGPVKLHADLGSRKVELGVFTAPADGLVLTVE